jgi:DNA-binding NtrC family response regulator
VKKTTVLLVGRGSRRQTLTSNLEVLGMEILFANDWRQARQLLQTNPEVAVAVTDLTLPDGNWCDVVQFAAQQDFQTSIVVVSRTGSERLWAELLWRGAHDLLVEPLNDREVRQTVEGAARAAEAARNRVGRVGIRVGAPSPVGLPQAAAPLS